MVKETGNVRGIRGILENIPERNAPAGHVPGAHGTNDVANLGGVGNHFVGVVSKEAASGSVIPSDRRVEAIPLEEVGGGEDGSVALLIVIHDKTTRRTILHGVLSARDKSEAKLDGGDANAVTNSGARRGALLDGVAETATENPASTADNGG